MSCITGDFIEHLNHDSPPPPPPLPPDTPATPDAAAGPYAGNEKKPIGGNIMAHASTTR